MGSTFLQKHFPMSLSTPLGIDRLLLDRIHGEEALSQLFHFTMELRSEDRALNFESIMGKPASVTVQLTKGVPRYISGIISRFVQAGTDKRFTNYRAELRPWFWLLTLTKDCRIFQNQSVPQIIETVFTDCGFTDFTNALSSTYQPREYCVQYQESAFAFVSRLMEEEGIFYFFTHEESRHELVFADDADAYPKCPGDHVVRYGAKGRNRREDNVVTQCTHEQEVMPGGFVADDYNFETPSTNLLVTVAGSDKNRKVYEYPGKFLTTKAGEELARRHLEAYELPGTMLKGEGVCRGFSMGHTFTLQDHERIDFNGSYVLSKVSFAATQESYSNLFEAFPLEIPFRPPATTSRPIIPGTQTAIVVGKKGEEIWTDKYGRIKVQFHWDQRGKRNENSSCWIRVAQGWAGKQWGAQFLPRIGQEVVVSFLDGDPDRPLITGAVYNAEYMPPFALPGKQTQSGVRSRSTKSGKLDDCNEIRFEDKKGKEELFVQAQKDMLVAVKNDRTTTIEEDELLEVTKGNRTISVKKGNEVHSVKGTRSLKVEDDEMHASQKNFTHNVQKNYVLKVQGNLTIDVSGTVIIKAGKSITTKAGTTITSKAGTSLTNQSGTSLTNKAGTSMTNQAAVSLTNKASASQTVDGGGMLTVKGGLVKIN